MYSSVDDAICDAWNDMHESMQNEIELQHWKYAEWNAQVKPNRTEPHFNNDLSDLLFGIVVLQFWYRLHA